MSSPSGLANKEITIHNMGALEALGNVDAYCPFTRKFAVSHADNNLFHSAFVSDQRSSTSYWLRRRTSLFRFHPLPLPRWA